MNLINGYDKIENILKDNSSWKEFRTTSFHDFQKMGLPTRKNEEWKYLNIKPLADHFFTATLTGGNKASLETESIVSKELNKDFYNLVFINGVLNKTISDMNELEKNIDLHLMEDVVAGKKPNADSIIQFFQKNFKKYGNKEENAFDKLNQAFVGQGIVIEVKPNTVLKRPLHILNYISLEGGLSLACHTQVYIQIGSGSNISVIETFSGQNDSRYFSNSKTEIFLNKNSKLNYLRNQSDSSQAFHIGRTKIYLDEFSTLNSLSYQVGSKLSRHNLDVYHIQKNSTSVIDGIYLCHKEQAIDNHTDIDHVVGECQSSQTYKGIIKDKAKAIFNGRVHIRHGSLKASSQQLNNNLLLSSEAEVDSKPELQIFADDVQATHGSTIGQMNEEEIFYFESRSIPRTTAIEMLSFGFVNELIQKIEVNSISNWLGQKMLATLRNL
mgnify:CR=1 FL=1